MNVYIKFLSFSFLKSILYVYLIMFSLVIILNVLTEIEFFKNYEVNANIPLYLAILNSFNLIFEMFPFIFLISTQLFFINLFTDDQIKIFKYSGLKNSKIIKILSLITFLLGLLIITLFYSMSSNFQKLYLEYKNKYSSDNKYLAVVTNNGLWIKDIINNNRLIINAKEIDEFILKDVNISVFNMNFELVKIITSNNADIRSNTWKLNMVTLVENNFSSQKDYINFKTNFNYEKINSLFSNLSSLSIFELLKLRENYSQINYSTIDIDVQLQTLLSLPIYFTLMTILSCIIMYNSKSFNSISLKITIGLFFCVIIYYLNNLFKVLGSTEKMPLTISMWITLIILTFVNVIAVSNINEK